MQKKKIDEKGHVTIIVHYASLYRYPTILRSGPDIIKIQPTNTFTLSWFTIKIDIELLLG